jgi:hypothetical protein
MLRVGVIILTFWAGVRLLLALGILAIVLVFGKNAPVLVVLYGESKAQVWTLVLWRLLMR